MTLSLTHHPTALSPLHLTLHLSQFRLSCGLGTPDALEESVSLGESVEAVVALGAGTNEAGQGIHLVLSGITAVLVNLADADLHAGVVLGLDDAVGGAALARHVAV